MTSAIKHFLDLHRISKAELRGILDDAHARKKARVGLAKGKYDPDRPLDGHMLAMIFEKPSTRTRVSFDVAMQQLGGLSLLLNGADMQLGRGESVADTARVLSRYVDAIMIRTTAHSNLLELAEHASVPVINGLTDRSHPCQLIADVMTFEEHKGPIKDRVVAWSGDGNNVAVSWIHAAAQFDFELRVASPADLTVRDETVEWAKEQGARITLTDDPYEAVDGADCVVADTWVSMGDSKDVVKTRHNQLAPYRVDERLMAAADKKAIFMHCLPAHRGEEMTEAVIDGPQSVVFDEAENRLHAQKSILTWCLT
ncbi:MAG: ornithine carbamoyltransferase [Alphaproteobacteria bacterium]|nr:ornithine carbamoyltransferase [Alphaproteobacteria bacterium]MBO6629327.1 ornithine carbamoyltransferase [Alphaproteobacteria bacterium]MDF1627390.1 ornithine carbamoyltransferase [Parvibaculaceae bacterium]